MMTSRNLTIVLFLAIVITSCNNDFELNADYQRQPVVFGILDPDRSDQIFTIHHTFLGDGSAFDYAQIEDSSTYNNIDARIFYNDGESSVVLVPEIIDDKDADGLFFAPEQLVYTAPTSDFNFDNNDDDVYRLGVMADGDTIYAETSLVSIDPTTVLLPISSSNPSVKTAFVSSASEVFGTAVYRTVPVKFTTVENALDHEVSIRLHYIEHDNNGDEHARMVEFKINSTSGVSSEGGSVVSFNYLGESFYQGVANKVSPDSNVDYRELDKIEFVFYAFGSDLSRYIDIINPTGSIGQETPSFSNINDGEGHGIFSSRGSYVREVRMSGKSIEELVHGQFTGALGFCASQEGFNCQ